MSKLTPLDNQVFNDGALVGVVGTAAVNVALGGNWFLGLLLGLVVAVPTFFAAGFFATFIADPPTVPRVTIAWALFAAICTEVARQFTGNLPFALGLGGVIFTYTTTRSLLVLRAAPALAAGKQPQALPQVPEPQTPPQAPRPRALPARPVPAGARPQLPPVPGDLPEELAAIAAAAVRDFDHLCDALDDPALAQAAGVDVPGLRGEAEALARDVLRRAPLVARVRRIAAERPDDAPAQKTSDDALAALRRQAEALRAATSVALQIAAAEGRDTSALRDHIDNLHLLRDARDDAESLTPR